METPEYFEHIGLLLADLMASGFLDSSTVRTVTNKSIYKEFMSDILPPKIVRESTVNYSHSWKRLHHLVRGSKERDIVYLLLHNKLPVPERLFRIKLRNDPYCRSCLGAEISDIEHYFCECSRISEVWSWVRTKIINFAHVLSHEENWNILNICFQKTLYEEEIIWLISNYIYFVWDHSFVREATASLNTFFGYLTFKYREFKQGTGRELHGMEDFK